ncbi:MAG: sulfatase-like hydrolase/transferase [Trueperaceae bacterium]|nr:sulfatase-like hydrolase/transferase [Trueperaceae bacterium]
MIENDEDYLGLRLRTLVTSGAKLTTYTDRDGPVPHGELFDLAEDPGELHNRWRDPAYANRKAELIAGLHHALVRERRRHHPPKGTRVSDPPLAPNLLVVMADQLRRDALGVYGDPDVATPNLDALAARGVRFTQACATSPICVPFRFSFMTGAYAHTRQVPAIEWRISRASAPGPTT